ncbi:hypothetical protein PVAP13_6KG007100 [Panicum virgatum]|uniref:Uncharacterized protein n=1 Tax=Panicum virgatum TaxID=38727 RepID=A0A8T0R5X4_PANVG|nr:hypothetical protein PVAP13_6KG007100 [Panicum virgatum]
MLVKKRPGALIITLERTTGVQNRIAVCSPKLWSLVRSELYASSTEISRYRSQSCIQRRRLVLRPPPTAYR